MVSPDTNDVAQHAKSHRVIDAQLRMRGKKKRGIIVADIVIAILTNIIAIARLSDILKSALYGGWLLLEQLEYWLKNYFKSYLIVRNHNLQIDFAHSFHLSILP